MNSPQILIKKGGFLAAVASGLFGFLTVTVIGATSLGLFGMHLVDKRLGPNEIGTALKNWREILPVADALNDVRAPEYRESVNVAPRLVTDADGDGRIVLTITNKGLKTVSFLSLRVIVEDGKHVPVSEKSIIAATPLALKRDWIGPLLPAMADGTATERELSKGLDRTPGADWTVRVEVTDIRVNVPLPASPETASR